MFTLDIPTILGSLHPGAQWAVRGPQNDYANLEWLDQTVKPTEQELLAAELAAAKLSRISRVKSEASARILAAYPTWKQTNAALGLADAGAIQTLKDGITAIRADSNTAEVAVNALTDVADVVAFVW